MPTFNTPFDAFFGAAPLPVLLQAARLAIDRMPARAKAAVRLARMDPPSWSGVTVVRAFTWSWDRTS
jgi:hypothetical protein